MNGCSVAEEASGMISHPAPPEPLGRLDLPPRRRPSPSCPWARPPDKPGLLAADVGLVHLHLLRTAIPGRAGPAPNVAGATSPTPSGRSRSATFAAVPAPRCRPWRWRMTSTRRKPHRQRRTRPVEDRARRHRCPMQTPRRTSTGRRQLAIRRHDRTHRRRNRPAIATTPSSRGNPRQCANHARNSPTDRG